MKKFIDNKLYPEIEVRDKSNDKMGFTPKDENSDGIRDLSLSYFRLSAFVKNNNVAKMRTVMVLINYINLSMQILKADYLWIVLGDIPAGINDVVIITGYD